MRQRGSNIGLERRAYNIRRHALRMAEVQGQGYIAQALGVADVLAVSYFEALNYRSSEPEWEGRDRFPAIDRPLRHCALCGIGRGEHPSGRGDRNLWLGRQPFADVGNGHLYAWDGNYRRITGTRTVHRRRDVPRLEAKEVV